MEFDNLYTFLVNLHYLHLINGGPRIGLNARTHYARTHTLQVIKFVKTIHSLNLDSHILCMVPN